MDTLVPLVLLVRLSEGQESKDECPNVYRLTENPLMCCGTADCPTAARERVHYRTDAHVVPRLNESP